MWGRVSRVESTDHLKHQNHQVGEGINLIGSPDHGLYAKPYIYTWVNMEQISF